MAQFKNTNRLNSLVSLFLTNSSSELRSCPDLYFFLAPKIRKTIGSCLPKKNLFRSCFRDELKLLQTLDLKKQHFM